MENQNKIKKINYDYKYNVGDYVVCSKLPTTKYAIDYISMVGIQLGTVCEIINIINDGVTVEIKAIHNSNTTEVGYHFLLEQFKPYYRFKNLDYLLGPDNKSSI